MSSWESVFFDFDGVLLDSVQVKTRAFRKLFSGYGPEVEGRVIRHHLANGGMSRFRKLQLYHAEFLGKPLDAQGLDRECARFADMVVDEVVASPFVPGAHETLKSLAERGTPAYVVSGTPHEEIQVIVKRRGLSRYFDEVHGSPRDKTDIVKDILGRKAYRPGCCIFVGDALSDYTAAFENGLHFLGIVPQGEPSCFPEGTVTSSRVLLPCPEGTTAVLHGPEEGQGM